MGTVSTIMPLWHVLRGGGPETAPNTLFAVEPHKGETVGATGLITAWEDQSAAGGDLVGISASGAINLLGTAPIAYLNSGYTAPFTNLAVPYSVYFLWSNFLPAEFIAENKFFYRSTSGVMSSSSTSGTQVFYAGFNGPAKLDDKWYVVRIIANGASSRIGFYDGTTLTESTGTNNQALVSEALSLLKFSSGEMSGRIGWLQMVDAVPDDPANDWILGAVAKKIPSLPAYSDRVAVDVVASQYSAFGNCVLSGSTLIAVWRRGASHIDMPANPGDLYISTATSPGTSWSAPVQFFTDSVDSYDARDPRITILSSGRWIVLFFLHDGTNLQSYVIYSDNQGSTWSSKILVTTSLTPDAGCSGPILQLANGDLIAALYGQTKIRFSRSTDDGATWADEGDEFDETPSLSEPNLGHLDDGTIMCLIRASDFTIWRAIATYSAGTLTWGSPAEVTDGSGAPGWMQHSGDGTITLCTRSKAYYDRNVNHISLCTKTSADRGATWSGESYPYPDTRIWEYGNPVELADGTKYIFYCQEFSGGAGAWWGPL